MKLPDRVYRFLERVVAAERCRRTQETTRRITAQDRALRAWANQARVAHEAGRCVDRCPFAHLPG